MREMAALPGLIRRRAAEIGDRTFLVDAERGSYTYRGFQRRIEECVVLLRHHGVVSGDRVAVLLPTCVDEQALWLACAWLGAVQVPINPAYRGGMLQHVLTDSRPRLVVTVPERLADVRATGGDTVLAHEIGRPLESEPDALAGLTEPERWDTAAVIYTSGTTGPSKGVLTPWGQLATGVEAFDDIGRGDCLYAPFAAYHLGGKVPLQILAHWGGTFVFRDGFKTDRFWPDVRTHRCNRAWAFHAMANFLWQQPERPEDRDNPLETITGGPLLADYVDFEKRFSLRMRTNYGMTEAGWPIATGDHVVDHRSCGRARDGYELRIVDGFDLEVADGEIGELIVRADRPWTMNLGYLSRPEDTARAWRNGWYHTGDAFRRDGAGNYFFVDRAKDAIRRRSENISSFEVETMVTAHPGVLECAAIGVPSLDGEEEIKVCVVRLPESDVDGPALAGFLEQTMPRFMVPRYIEFLDELPKTPNSKVRKVVLKQAPFTAATWDRMTR